MLKRSLKFSLFALMLVAAAMMFGCGSDGDPGPTGATGATGPTGPPGTSVSATVETCTICHGAGSIADIADMHPQLLQETLISDIAVTNSATGFPTVTFHVATTDGTALEGISDDAFQFAIADLVPEDTDTAQGTWDNPYFERWARERTSGTFGTLTDLLVGDYSYEFATAFGSVEEGSTPADDIDPTPTGHSQRLMIMVDGQVNPTTLEDTFGTAAYQDFMVPAAGGPAATPLVPQRQYVTAAACKECHGPEFDRAAHASSEPNDHGYYDTLGCVMCHSPLGHYGDIMQENYVYFGPLVKQIHQAIENDAFAPPDDGRPIIDGATNPLELDLYSWADVAFPQEVQNCVICHNDGGSAVPTDVDHYLTNPTAQLCGGCHTDVDFTTGENHPGGIQPNSACTVCHQAAGPVNSPSSYPIPGVHDTTPRVAGTNGTGDPGYKPENIPEFDVTLTLSPQPANGTYYVPGDVITVTGTLADHSTGDPVSSEVYTTGEDDAGVVGGGLHEAYVQVSGPRSNAAPVLATDTEQDPNYADFEQTAGFDGPEDEHPMFVAGDNVDPQAKSDSSGFKYQLFAIPDDLTPGTYIVRVVFADYGYISSSDYNIDSTAWTIIQIGTATEQLKVSGDACVNCHGSGTAPFHDARHSVPFDTDQCLACHHDTGVPAGTVNHGVPLANRVHAVHYANPYGDIRVFSEGSQPSSRPWNEVSFPRTLSPDDQNSGCIACHTSGNPSYLALPYEMPCAGCHVGNPDDPLVAGNVAHMNQNGGPWLLAPTE